MKREYLNNGKTKIETPSYATSDKVEVSYTVLLENEKDFSVKFASHCNQTYKVHVNLFLIGYKHQEKQAWEYFLAVGTDFDYYLKPLEPIKESKAEMLVTEDDIISLKTAFINKDLHNISSTKCENKSFNDWLKYTVETIVGETCQEVSLEYSLTDIRVVKVDNTTEGNYIKAFANKFFDNIPVKIEETLGDNYTRLAYGLLHAHDNYRFLGREEINEKQKHFYSDLISERFYSAEKNILFLRTHYPFNYPEEEKRKFLEEKQYFDFTTLPNILEMCIAVHKNKKMMTWRDIVSNGKKPTEIRNAISDMTQELNRYYFNLYELDNKIWFIDESWSFYDMFKEICVLGEQHAVSLNIKETLKISRTTLCIAVVSCMLTLFNILQYLFCR